MLKVKTVPLEFGTEDTVLPEQRFVGLHTLMSHAERENVKKNKNYTVEIEGGARGCGTYSSTLETIKLNLLF